MRVTLSAAIATRAQRSSVPRVGFEPTRCCHQEILSLSRLPFRHRGVYPLYQSYSGFVLVSIQTYNSAFMPDVPSLLAPFRRFLKQGNAATLTPIVLVAVVNALSYGTIIPLLYPYAQRYGLTAVGLGMLFASFSLFQFLATPVMGRLSDRYGRKPLLIFSLLGTAGSLVLFALAHSVPFLFLARILDGITGGNVSVAQAVIADVTEGEDRDKSFGLIGAAFGFGFLIGPALGGLLSGIAVTLPFFVAAGIALVAALITQLFLPETLSEAQRDTHVTDGKPLFDGKSLFTALRWPVLGKLLLATFAVSTAHSILVVGFNSYSVDVFQLNEQALGAIFTGLGLVTLLMQAFGIGFLLQRFGSKRRVLLVTMLLAAFFNLVTVLAPTPLTFAIVTLFYAASFAPQNVMLTGLLSERTQDEDQGGVLGIQQSYVSLGQIVGPVIAGAVAQVYSGGVFVVAAAAFVGAWVLFWKQGATDDGGDTGRELADL